MAKRTMSDDFEEYSDEEENPVRSNRLEVGPFIAISKIVEEYHLEELLYPYFGNGAYLLLDLAACLLTAEGSSSRYYYIYACSNPLFSEGMKVYSDEIIESFLWWIDVDRCRKFLEDWNSRQVSEQKVLISFGLADRNMLPGEISFVESHLIKKDMNTDFNNFCVAYGKSDGRPLFYDTYLGLDNDLYQLECTCMKAEEYGYKDCTIIMDRGIIYNQKTLEEEDPVPHHGRWPEVFLGKFH